MYYFSIYREVEEFVKLLCDLRVWQTIEIRGGIDGLLLNPTFRKNLKGALLGGYIDLMIL
jgi:transcription initiation factor TFIIH subunit 4